MLSEWGDARTFLAEDGNGEVSAPIQCSIFSGDVYEPDDDSLHASGFEVGGYQHHNFHATNDQDWVAFYALSKLHLRHSDLPGRGRG